MRMAKRKKRRNDSVVDDGDICGKMNFQTAEAYKMLRTKINLVVPHAMEGENDSGSNHICEIIGITSSLRGEGKTTSAINLAYTIAEAGKKVCLIEADMRLPSLHKRLSIKGKPGLSNLLTGQIYLKDAIQKYASENGNDVYVLSAGDIPPTPSELLESPIMENLLNILSKLFDYVILDLPPVTVVTDALAVSKYLDEMLLVVRENYCDKSSLRETLYQFELTDTKILGVIFNCSDNPAKSRSRYYYYQ